MEALGGESGVLKARMQLGGETVTRVFLARSHSYGVHGRAWDYLDVGRLDVYDWFVWLFLPELGGRGSGAWGILTVLGHLVLHRALS